MTFTALPKSQFRLTQNQIHQFNQNGFLLIRDFASASDVEQSRKLLTNVFAQYKNLPEDIIHHLEPHRNPDEAPRNLEIHHCRRLEQRLIKTKYFSNVKAVAKQLLGFEARLWFDHAILKPPYSNCATMWHQDEAYGQGRAANQQISFWLPLQDATVESGCLHFVPNSHKVGLLPHRPWVEGAFPLVTDEVDTSQAVPCPLNAGDISVHYGQTLHYAGPNVTNKSRLAWVLVFRIDSWVCRFQRRLVFPMQPLPSKPTVKLSPTPSLTLPKAGLSPRNG